MSKKIAIIGAGFSGTYLGFQLKELGHEVEIFEKARGPGGRTSSRRAKLADGREVSIDHGAQFIEVTKPEFQNFVDEQIEAGNLKLFEDYRFYSFDKSANAWDRGKVGFDAFVPVPKMNQLAKIFSAGLNANYQTCIDKVGLDNELFDEKGQVLGQFDFVISTAPPLQTYELMREHKELVNGIDKVDMKPHYAVMLVSDKEHDFDFDAVNVLNSTLNWIGINSNKPGRDKKPLAISMHTNFKWTKENLDLSDEEVITACLKDLKEITGFEDESPLYLTKHRWLYGRAMNPLEDFYRIDAKVALVGDWLCGDNIEAAYLSCEKFLEVFKKL